VLTIKLAIDIYLTIMRKLMLWMTAMETALEP